MERETCPVCGGNLVAVAGPVDSPILLVGAYPGWEELREGRPWVGNAGDVFRQELGKAGINYRDCRVTNLWRHQEITPKHEYYEEEWEWHTNNVEAEMSERKAVLLMGRQPVLHFCKAAVTDVENMTVKSPMFPPNIEVAVAMRNPAQVLTEDGAVVGNVRHAIRRFAELTKDFR